MSSILLLFQNILTLLNYDEFLFNKNAACAVVPVPAKVSRTKSPSLECLNLLLILVAF
jgi:hypothetical protein